MQELEKNLRTYLNNIPYDQKDTVREHILALIRFNQCIPCVRTGVAKNQDDSFYCYIEAFGFITIGKEMHQIKILFPHNYPVATPQFHLLYKSDQYKIQNEESLIANKLINLQKSPANQTFINIACPALRNLWRSDKRNVCEAYREVQKWLNNPPILVEKPKMKQQEMMALRGTNPTSCADRFLLDIQLQALQLQDSMQKCEKGQRDIDFNLARVDFLKKNLPKLSRSMKSFEQNICNKANQLQSISQQLTFDKNCDGLLQINEQQKKKMKILATREGLKQGEKKLTKAIQNQMRNHSTKFSDYKNIIRKLSQRMFEAQLNYLKLSD